MLRQAYATRGQGKSARGRDLHHAETDVAEELKVMTMLGKRTDKSGSYITNALKGWTQNTLSASRLSVNNKVESSHVLISLRKVLGAVWCQKKHSGVFNIGREITSSVK